MDEQLIEKKIEQKRKRLPQLPASWNISKNQIKSISGKININKRKEIKLKELFDEIRLINRHVMLGNNSVVYANYGRMEFLCYYTEKSMKEYIKQMKEGF